MVAHSIAVINFQAGVAVHVLDRRPEQARAALLAIKQASGEALQAAGDHPRAAPALASQGLVAGAVAGWPSWMGW